MDDAFRAGTASFRRTMRNKWPVDPFEFTAPDPEGKFSHLKFLMKCIAEDDNFGDLATELASERNHMQLDLIREAPSAFSIDVAERLATAYSGRIMEAVHDFRFLMVLPLTRSHCCINARACADLLARFGGPVPAFDALLRCANLRELYCHEGYNGESSSGGRDDADSDSEDSDRNGKKRRRILTDEEFANDPYRVEMRKTIREVFGRLYAGGV